MVYQKLLLFSIICRLDTLDTVYRGHKMALDTARRDIEEAQTNISTCKQSTGGLEERYRFFQEMRGYVRDLVECLNEKVGHHFVWEGFPCLYQWGRVTTMAACAHCVLSCSGWNALSSEHLHSMKPACTMYLRLGGNIFFLLTNVSCS